MRMIRKISIWVFYVLILFLSPGIHASERASKTVFNQKYINIDGVRVRYIDEGSGIPILLIHGHQSRIEEFDNIIPALALDYRVLAFDLPGSGYSEQPDIQYSLEYYEDVILKFTTQLNLDDPVIAGGSLGGNLALRVSRRYPGRFRKTIAWSPAGVWPPHENIAWLAEVFYDSPLYSLRCTNSSSTTERNTYRPR